MHSSSTRAQLPTSRQGEARQGEARQGGSRTRTESAKHQLESTQQLSPVAPKEERARVLIFSKLLFLQLCPLFVTTHLLTLPPLRALQVTLASLLILVTLYIEPT